MKSRSLYVALALTIAAAAAMVFTPAPAAAGDGPKFFVVEWRLDWDEDDYTTAEDGTRVYALKLKMKGRASLDGRDFDKDFEMELADATPYLELLRTCAMGRMSGSVSRYDTQSGKIIGEKLSSLSCRAILK